MSRPAFGLLLDVDGPISNPDAKQIIEPTIIASLVSLLNRGIPVVFNTGRADAFVRQRILSPLLNVDLERVDRLHAVCEKGAVWLSVTEDRNVTEELDSDIAVPRAMWDAIESLVKERFSDTMFFDQEERTMVSVERVLTVSHERYEMAQAQFINEAFEVLGKMGFGMKLGDRSYPDENGRIAYRIDPTIIACDIESIVVGKDLGASRAYELLQRNDALPEQWRTLGDSDTDYAMASWLDEKGEKVKHLDVRSLNIASVSSRFEVLRPTRSVFDDAGGAYLRWLLSYLSGATKPESEFDV